MSLQQLLVTLFCCLVPAVVMPMESPASIKVEVTGMMGDRAIYQQGDSIEVYISLDKTAYVLILYQDVAGNLLQVLPNKFEPQHHFTADDFIAFPASGSSFRLRVQPPFGQESLWVLATAQPLKDVPGKWLGSGVKKLAVSLDQLTSEIRSGRYSDFGIAKLKLATRPR